MSNTYFNQFFNTKHAKPVLLDARFVVTPTNGNGVTLVNSLGVSPTVMSPGIANIFMHTSTTPSTGNPNPAAGEIIVQLQDSYRSYFGGFSSFVSPLAGSPGASTTANVINVITALGTATLAQWQAVGLPIGITPAVGVSFVATSAASIGGSATVDLRATAGAGIDHIEVVGSNMQGNLTNGSIRNPAVVPAAGGYLYMACFKNTALTAPATGSIINLGLYLGDSSARV